MIRPPTIPVPPMPEVKPPKQEGNNEKRAAGVAMDDCMKNIDKVIEVMTRRIEKQANADYGDIYEIVSDLALLINAKANLYKAMTSENVTNIVNENA